MSSNPALLSSLPLLLSRREEALGGGDCVGGGTEGGAGAALAAAAGVFVLCIFFGASCYCLRGPCGVFGQGYGVRGRMVAVVVSVGAVLASVVGWL